MTTTDRRDEIIHALAWALARERGGIDVVRLGFGIPEDIDL